MNETVSLKAKAPMMMASLFLSFLLWAYIQFTQPPGSKDAEAKIGGVNMEKYLSRYIFPDDLGTVPIRIDGPQDQLTEDQAGLTKILRENRVYVYVDFDDLRPGVHSYPLHVVYRHDSPFTFTPLQGSISEDVEVRAERRFPVTIDATGEVPKDLNIVYTGSTTAPSMVVVSGPAPAVNQVKRVRGLLDLSKVEPHGSYPQALDPLDENDRAVPGVDVSPAAVNVLPALAPSAQSQMVLIQPVFSGHPALGMSVSNYTVEPNQIAVQGPPELLAKLQTVGTHPILLDGLGSSSWLEATLDLPAGVKVYSPRPVRVHIFLKAQNNGSGPTPNQTITGP
jgi:YbbR domain-containing protein